MREDSTLEHTVQRVRVVPPGGGERSAPLSEVRGSSSLAAVRAAWPSALAAPAAVAGKYSGMAGRGTGGDSAGESRLATFMRRSRTQLALPIQPLSTPRPPMLPVFRRTLVSSAAGEGSLVGGTAGGVPTGGRPTDDAVVNVSSRHATFADRDTLGIAEVFDPDTGVDDDKGGEGQAHATAVAVPPMTTGGAPSRVTTRRGMPHILSG